MITRHYCYMQKVQLPGEAVRRYVIPLADPYEFEQPFDPLFDTPEEAAEYLAECIEEEFYGGEIAKIRDELVLVKVTMEPVP